MHKMNAKFIPYTIYEPEQIIIKDYKICLYLSKMCMLSAVSDNTSNKTLLICQEFVQDMSKPFLT